MRLRVVFYIFLLLFPPPVCFAEYTEKGELHLGVDALNFPGQAQSDVQISLKLWVQEIGVQAGIKVNVHVYEDIENLRDDFEKHVINVVLTSPIRYIKYFDLQHLAKGFKASKLDKPFDTLVLLTRIDENIETFTDLRDKHLSLLHNDELAEIYLDTLSLKSIKKTHSNFFDQVSRESSIQRLILKLFFKNTDAVVVYQQAFELAIELNPQIKEKIKVLQYFERIPWKIGFFHIDEDEGLRQRIIEKTVNLSEYTRGKQLLELFKMDKVIVSEVADLNAPRRLYAEHQSLVLRYSQ
jgi:phosphonate transport system substrate-binding protein